MKTVADVVNALFAKYHDRTGTVLSNREVVRRAQKNGFNISEQSLGSIRQGIVVNPTLMSLNAIVSAFPGTSIDVFSGVGTTKPDAEGARKRYEELAAKFGLSVSHSRLNQMSSQELEDLLGILEEMDSRREN